MSNTPPVRTCVGCRKREAKSDLLRVVGVVATSKHPEADDPAATWSVVPDEEARRPGRGAYLHLRSECLDQAERRRAFSRALRLEGPFDTTMLRSLIEPHRRPSPEDPA